MKKRTILGLLSLFLITASAHAETPRPERWELFRFDFNCQFRDQDHRPATDSVSDGRGEFRARSEVFAWVNPDDWMSRLQQARDVENKLIVERDERIIYANTAFLNPGHRFVTITGIQGWPTISVERRDHDHGPDLLARDDFDARLILGDERIRGTCEVRSEPVHDHGHGSTLN